MPHKRSRQKRMLVQDAPARDRDIFLPDHSVIGQSGYFLCVLGDPFARSAVTSFKSL
jgi:hypothetical protein